ncbi:hypothetical protein CF327_g4171 [Tilletia walkeri]|nr:hypothetical protein CF327_g4171 [Tilletia walkeri]
MPHSHHSHSGEYCSHAKDSLTDILTHAHSLGFTTYALSEHVPRALDSELYPEERQLKLNKDSLVDRFKSYLIHARKLQAQYDNAPRSSQGSSMDVLVGCETESTDGPEGNHLDFFINLLNNTLSPSVSQDESKIPSRIGVGVVDYIVGSVHHVHSIPIDFDKETFNKALQHYAPQSSTTENQHLALMADYLDAQLHLLQRLRPEVIGHFDLCRLYAPQTAMKPASDQSSKELEQVWAKVDRNVRFAASYGALFEINSASFRKGWETAYPGPEILELILSLGGRICLSDDSHGTAQVGLNYTHTRSYLLSLQPSPPLLWYLRRRQPIPSYNQDEEDEEEVNRVARENSERPGAGAPTLFGRGTQAVPCWAQEWSDWPGWEKIAARDAASSTTTTASASASS